MEIYSNIVEQETLQDQSLKTLGIISDSLLTSFGPYGSATQIKKDGTLPKFTKDGHTILCNIFFNGVIELGLREVLEDLTKHVVKEVGDGTTSAIILSHLIYKRLNSKLDPDTNDLYDLEVAPSEIEANLKEIAKEAEEIIKSKAKPVATYEDIKKIALISTNNNQEMAELISNVYMENGTDVYIDVKRSTDSNDYMKIFDGMTLNTGYSNKEFVNNEAESTAEVNAPNIYFFEDPIDTPEMIEFLGAIVYRNIFEKINDKEAIVPTVIVTPKMSKDTASVMDPLIKTILNARQSGVEIPFVLITNLHQTEQFMDLANLTGARTIRKYINFEQQAIDQQNGDAPTAENVHEWCGHADAVIAGYNKTKFINPKNMYEEGTNEFSAYYKAILNNLQAQLENARKDGKDLNAIGNLRRRIHSMKANMVDLYIGGSTPEERDNRFDAAEDAVLNCMSAAEHGYGWGANVQGLLAIKELVEKYADTEGIKKDLVSIIYNSYLDLLAKLYATKFGQNPESYAAASSKVKDLTYKTLSTGIPVNLRTGETDSLVLSSIRSDITILGIVTKVVGMLVTTKQFLCQTPAHNIYRK